MAFFGSSWFEDDKPIGPFAHWLEDESSETSDRCCSSCVNYGRCDITLEDDDDDCVEWKQK